MYSLVVDHCRYKGKFYFSRARFKLKLATSLSPDAYVLFLVDLMKAKIQRNIKK